MGLLYSAARDSKGGKQRGTDARRAERGGAVIVASSARELRATITQKRACEKFSSLRARDAFATDM